MMQPFSLDDLPFWLGRIAAVNFSSRRRPSNTDKGDGKKDSSRVRSRRQHASAEDANGDDQGEAMGVVVVALYVLFAVVVDQEGEGDSTPCSDGCGKDADTVRKTKVAPVYRGVVVVPSSDTIFPVVGVVVVVVVPRPALVPLLPSRVS